MTGRPFTGDAHDGGLLALLPMAVFRMSSSLYMRACSMKAAVADDFAAQIGSSMSYTRCIPTPQSDPRIAAPGKNTSEKEISVRFGPHHAEWQNHRH